VPLTGHRTPQLVGRSDLRRVKQLGHLISRRLSRTHRLRAKHRLKQWQLMPRQLVLAWQEQPLKTPRKVDTRLQRTRMMMNSLRSRRYRSRTWSLLSMKRYDYTSTCLLASCRVSSDTYTPDGVVTMLLFRSHVLLCTSCCMGIVPLVDLALCTCTRMRVLGFIL
jgi:hypothetical protein